MDRRGGCETRLSRHKADLGALELRWRPESAGDYALVARATDGEGKLQEYDEKRPFKSGITGFHKINVRIAA